jgi:methylase of polypeptide subunit release factors
MNEDLQQDKFISKNNTGFPPYLDWDQMRSDAIGYLGELSGKIWTDYNTHDPGITILEVLCYALMDLGYRTNLPVEDLFAKDPAVSKEDNFFTPAQILTCNPVTIMDFRKMLIDIDGVKNAWLEDAVVLDPSGYNGLYHVYVELEVAVTDPGYSAVIGKIREALMAHRNLCEDFIDIHVLCKKTIGLCADIELETDADVKTVYRNIIEGLRNFFSPSPKFYTLSQLLDEKGKNIEDIFAGRPYNILESHGFVDTKEFEQITLKKEIHLSDVYHVIFDVQGVRSVKNLAWKKNCGDKTAKPDKSWVWKLPDHHVPDFSADCSVFSFNRRGVPVAVDTTKFNTLFNIDFNHNGKVIYPASSPYLDLAMPDGVYRSELGEYLSIQNEFPRVYGIARGGLPKDATTRRQAQALQLKAYLLFFDQLLANYVAQLKNIRSLFAFSSPKKGEAGSTYFTSQLTDLDDLQSLVRFDAGDNSAGIAGVKGSTLAIPFSRQRFEELVKNDKIKKVCGESDFEPYTYATLYDCDVAVANLMQDLLYGGYSPSIFQNENNRWFFCYLTSDNNFVLVGKQFYDKEETAREAASTVLYTGTYPDNFSTFMDSEQKCSFSLKLKLAAYSDYLKKITEDADLYSQRREAFLNHLLSRFAEKFTDFAMLSFGFLDEKALTKKEIADKENFLSHYDELSSNRGRGYDYRQNGWKSGNVSGFEKRFAALAGIGDPKRTTLCHFVVEKYETQFICEIGFPGEKPMFTSTDRFFSPESAAQAAKEIFKALLSESNYEIYFDFSLSVFLIRVSYGDNRTVQYNPRFDRYEDAVFARDALLSFFSVTPTEKDVYDGKKAQKIILSDYGHQQIAVSKADYPNPEEANAAASQPATILAYDSWDWREERGPFKDIYLNTSAGGHLSFIDVSPFDVDCDNDIVGKPDKFTYEVRYTDNEFILKSVDGFASREEAKIESYRKMMLLADRANLYIHKTNSDTYRLQLRPGKKAIAVFEGSFRHSAEAERAKIRVSSIVQQLLFHISIEERTIRWNFGIHMGYEKPDYFLFKSNDDFDSAATALQKANEYYAAMGTMAVTGQGPATALSCNTANGQVICTYAGQPGDGDLDSKIGGLVGLKKNIYQLVTGDPAVSYQQFVRHKEADPDLQYVYRLADKNRYHAFYTGAAGTGSESDVAAKKNELFQNRIEYVHIDISLAGDVAVETKEGFHFKLQLNKPSGQLPAGTILFESVKAYDSLPEAAAAFDAGYQEILAKAMDEANYGQEGYISLEEIPAPENAKTRSVVFVPAATRQLFSDDLAQLRAGLIKLARQYPVRYLVKDSDEFKKRFACKPDLLTPAPPAGCGISAVSPEIVYYYILADKDGSEQWQSAAWFETREKAIYRFNFFFDLLSYPGNYTVDRDFCVCSWRIFIREVLAESAVRFDTEEKAWGKDGVEKFICAAQTSDSFRTFFQTKADCYTFNVECGKPRLIHPREYDTAGQRDTAVGQLWHLFMDSAGDPQAHMAQEADVCILYDRKGQRLATVAATGSAGSPGTADAAAAACSTKLADLGFLVYKNGWEANDAARKLSIPGTAYSFSPYDSDTDLQTWKHQLKSLFYLYPVKKTADNTYWLELKFSGFDGIAWLSTNSFTTDQQVLDFLGTVNSCLAEPDNYKHVFDCSCGPYGIQLNCDDILRVAFNPQYYSTPEMVCDAVKRAKELINAEGIHLVEHILLRPRTDPELACALKPCVEGQKKITCSPWPWKPGGEKDPCDPITDEIEFSPGADAYSFIATVVLPAWPERFRTAHNRQILENLLYQEAPAHVLLRILWLAPKDLDLFESHFRNWTTWNSSVYRAYKDCITENPTCDLVDFLFRSDFECLHACADCTPEMVAIAKDTGCDAPVGNDDQCTGVTITNNINELFCWETVDCIPEIQIPREISSARKLGAQDQAKLFNKRTDSYRKTLSQILPDENEMNVQIMRFLNDPNPNNQKYTDLINVIVNDSQQVLNDGAVTKQYALIRTITSHYLDRLVAADGNIDRIAELRVFFKQLRRNKQLDLFSILKSWK